MSTRAHTLAYFPSFLGGLSIAGTGRSMEQPRENAGDLDAMAGRRWSEFLPGGKAAGEFLVEHSSDHGGDEEEEDGHEDGGGSLHSLQSHVTFASLPSYMRSKSGMEMDPDRVSSSPQSKSPNACLFMNPVTSHSASKPFSPPLEVSATGLRLPGQSL